MTYMTRRRTLNQTHEALPGPPATTSRMSLLPPEILLMVFEYLGSWKNMPSLCKALRVDKEWAELGTNILWREPPAAALARIPKSRQQYYANKIHELCFITDDDGNPHPSYKKLAFPRLKIVSIDYLRLRKNQKLWIRQYLQPNLEIFMFYGGNAPENLLDLLEYRCPYLREIMLDHTFDIDAKVLVKFLDNCKNLVDIDLGKKMNNLITGELFTHLASRENLWRLDLWGLVTADMVQEACDKVAQPFQNTAILKLRVGSKSVEPLISSATSLGTLFLHLEDSNHDVLYPISSLKSLIHLELRYREDTTLSRDSILAIGNCRKLYAIVIGPIWEDITVQAPELTDTDFARLMMSLPLMEDFTFQVQCNLTAKSITAAGRHCSLLRSFDLFGTYDLLRTWGRLKNPLFPQLRRLVLDAAAYETLVERSPSPRQGRAQKLGRLVSELAPNLEGLYLYKRDEFSRAVIEEFESMTGHHGYHSLPRLLF